MTLRRGRIGGGKGMRGSHACTLYNPNGSLVYTLFYGFLALLVASFVLSVCVDLIYLGCWSKGTLNERESFSYINFPHRFQTEEKEAQAYLFIMCCGDIIGVGSQDNP
jgi:hypothetical protein